MIYTARGRSLTLYTKNNTRDKRALDDFCESNVLQMSPLVEFMYPVFIACMSGGVIVGDSGLCCYVTVQCATSIVRAKITSHCLLIELHL